MISAAGSKARSELTFKHNIKRGRHGWLRLTPAYSVKLVDGILDQCEAISAKVFDPFSGTGTTPLCAAYRGLDATSFDINPFLVWLGRVKSATYSKKTKVSFDEASEDIIRRLSRPTNGMGELPELHNIERWWNGQELRFVSALRDQVEKYTGQVHDLLRIAFCRTMIGLSNAAFNHQSMSFKDGVDPHAAQRPNDSWKRCLDHFAADAQLIATSLEDSPTGSVQVEQADARSLAARSNGLGKFDIIITSPPYPNRMSYIRELRPYMYWLRFLNTGKAAGELDWEAIGGTWGIATSRLLTWQPSDGYIPKYLHPVIELIRGGHPKNGELMARYVHKYFDDMSLHFRSVRKLMNSGGSVHYIIGNSTFYGNMVSSERLYVDQLKDAGFKNPQARAIRKRNSKKELVEYHVFAET